MKSIELMQIKTKNSNEHLALITVLHSLGYRDSLKNNVFASFERLRSFPVILVYKSAKFYCGNFSYYPNNGPELTFEDLPKIVSILTNSKPPIVVENVGEYTAVINDDGINVGCQTISFEKFDEVAKAVKEYRS